MFSNLYVSSIFSNLFVLSKFSNLNVDYSMYEFVLQVLNKFVRTTTTVLFQKMICLFM